MSAKILGAEMNQDLQFQEFVRMYLSKICQLHERYEHLEKTDSPLDNEIPLLFKQDPPLQKSAPEKGIDVNQWSIESVKGIALAKLSECYSLSLQVQVCRTDFQEAYRSIKKILEEFNSASLNRFPLNQSQVLTETSNLKKMTLLASRSDRIDEELAFNLVLFAQVIQDILSLCQRFFEILNADSGCRNSHEFYVAPEVI